MNEHYRMPAEWGPHGATWLIWPCNRDDWPGKLGLAQFDYVQFVKWLVRFEKVCMIVKNQAIYISARRLMRREGVDVEKIHFCFQETDRSWARDTAPTFVYTAANHKKIIQWDFNGWGKYSNFENDRKVAAAISRDSGIGRVAAFWKRHRVVLEGGAIDVDGNGLLLATEECLLSTSQKRNPGFTQEDYEVVFKKYLGIERTVWLSKGITGDDTHGHIDDVARFVNVNHVVAAYENNDKDDNYKALHENFERLQHADLKVTPLPMPSTVYYQGQRLPASYLNFYIANGAVFVPTFNDPQDRITLEILASLFPGRQVIGINSVNLVWGFGTLHCLTQQEPA